MEAFGFLMDALCCLPSHVKREAVSFKLNVHILYDEKLKLLTVTIKALSNTDTHKPHHGKGL